MGTERRKRPQIHPLPSSPLRPTIPIVTLGKAKERSLIRGILLNILGLAVAPLGASSLPPAKANSE